MTTDHLKQVLNAYAASKTKTDDMQYARLLLKTYDFGFFERGRILKQLESLEGKEYHNKKKELITMSEQKLEDLLSRRDFLKKTGIAAAGVAAASIIPGFAKKAFAQDSLYDAELFENNYRQIINQQPVCFVAYHRTDRKGSFEMQLFVADFRKEMSGIAFFHADLKNFSQFEIDIIKTNDTHTHIVPVLVLYKNGTVIDQGRGYPQTNQYNDWKNYFKKLI